jgi:hypothetical protein
MKGAALAATAGISLIAIIGMVASATGTGGKHRQVVCFNGGYPRHFPYKPVYKRKPRHCVFTKNNRPPDYADSIDVGHLRWSVWGRFHARGKDKTGVNMVGVVPIQVKLYGVKNAAAIKSSPGPSSVIEPAFRSAGRSTWRPAPEVRAATLGSAQQRTARCHGDSRAVEAEHRAEPTLAVPQ